MNKELIVENRRLGLLHRILLLAALTIALVNLILNQPWFEIFNPHARYLELWTTGVRQAAPETCQSSNLEMYYYRHDQDFNYAPERCSTLPPGESFRKHGGTLDFATFAEDKHIWRQQGPEACHHARLECQDRNGTYTVLDEGCSCETEEQFLVQHAEQNHIWLNHGFNVLMDLKGSAQQMGRTTDERVKSITYTPGGGEHVEQHADGILTIIRRPDGSECQVSGKSRWFPTETIHGTLQEWLLCGGMTLDDSSPSLRATSTQVVSPRVRITGASLELTLQYSNYERVSGFGGIVCSLIVNAVPVWNSWTSVRYTFVPKTSNPSSPSTYRYRYNYGVSIRTRVEGNFGFFDWNLLITAIMAHVVLLTLPRRIVTLLAINGAGLASTIYKRALKETISINQEFHGFCARLMGHAQSFRSITGSTYEQETSLTENDLRKFLFQAFQSHKRAFHFSDDQVYRLAHVVLNGCDPDGNGTISQHEYVYAASRNEVLDMKEVCLFFDYTRRKSILEHIFGDSHFDPAHMERKAIERETSHASMNESKANEFSKDQSAEPKFRTDGQDLKASREQELIPDGAAKAIQMEIQNALHVLRAEFQEELRKLDERWMALLSTQPCSAGESFGQRAESFDGNSRTTESRVKSNIFSMPQRQAPTRGGIGSVSNRAGGSQPPLHLFSPLRQVSELQFRDRRNEDLLDVQTFAHCGLQPECAGAPFSFDKVQTWRPTTNKMIAPRSSSRSGMTSEDTMPSVIRV